MTPVLSGTTSPTPGGQCARADATMRGDLLVMRRRTKAFSVLVLLLPCLVSACGTLSRAVLARQEFAEVYSDRVALTVLRGAEAGQPFLWLESGRVAAVDSPDAALALVERGLAFHPSDPGLRVARIELLGGLGRYEDCLAAARESLACLPMATASPTYRMALVRALLALDRLDEVEPEIIAVGGDLAAPPELVADMWARLALGYAVVGRRVDADRCFDASLARGTSGLRALAQETLLHPERVAAARALRGAAAARDPRDPDLALSVVVDLMERQQYAEAEAALDALPAPLPVRLVSDALAIGARLMILQGRVDDGLQILFARLDVYPFDPPALGVLQETWARLGRPPDDVMQQRLLVARRYVDSRDRSTLLRLDALLDELQQRLR